MSFGDRTRVDILDAREPGSSLGDSTDIAHPLLGVATGVRQSRS
jgi:hypothetical protein